MLRRIERNDALVAEGAGFVFLLGGLHLKPYRPVRGQPCSGHRDAHIGGTLPSADRQLKKKATFPDKSGACWALMPGPALR